METPWSLHFTFSSLANMKILIIFALLFCFVSAEKQTDQLSAEINTLKETVKTLLDFTSPIVIEHFRKNVGDTCCGICWYGRVSGCDCSCEGASYTCCWGLNAKTSSDISLESSQACCSRNCQSSNCQICCPDGKAAYCECSAAGTTTTHGVCTCK
mmetsp:Transcript_3857/g.5390  ORF Transcript_3857/g.5390 Transcript_3857/m.5390 type:complete len:156 (+) Transcript_3857:37-504(+)